MNILKNMIWIASILLVPFMGSAQSAEYKLNKNSTMVITGTSTIHDWEANVEEMDLSVSLDPALLVQKNPEAGNLPVF